MNRDLLHRLCSLRRTKSEISTIESAQVVKPLHLSLKSKSLYSSVLLFDLKKFCAGLFFATWQLTAHASRSKLESTVSKTGSPTRARSSSPGKGGKKGGKKDSDKPVSPKKDTKLKKRGEENDITETIGKSTLFIPWFKYFPVRFYIKEFT